MTTRFIFSMVLILAGVHCNAQAPEKQVIRRELTKLSNMLGRFQLEASLAGVKETGIADVTWFLDSTYLYSSFDITIQPTGAKKRYMVLITFNASTNLYESTTYYANTSFRVNHTGTYNDATKILHREAINTFPNRTEYVVNVIDLSNPDRWTFKSFQGLSKNPERLAYEGVYTRIKS